MKELFLLRGLPGAGKSTFANCIGGSWYEADHFFLNEKGEYEFNASNLKAAHEWCRQAVEESMSNWNGINPDDKIVVSNTFTQAWEMQPYYDLAEKYGYRVYSLVVENRHGGENVHNVPREKIEEMARRFSVKIL